jgi:NADH:ubiquinone oxidoreductase subunit 6 (subunit J)
MAVMAKSLLKSAIYLAVVSATLGAILYLLGATWAAVIEVSACSGLVTVIFISAISLSRMKKDDIQKTYEDKKQMRFLPYLLIVGGIGLIAAAILLKDLSLPGAVETAAEDFRDIFWNTRQADIFGQIITILVGGIAVSVLFKDNNDDK